MLYSKLGVPTVACEASQQAQPPRCLSLQYCWFFALQLVFTWVLILFGSAINLSFFRRTDYGFQFVFYLCELEQGQGGDGCEAQDGGAPLVWGHDWPGSKLDRK